jgi:hypothetical protein
MCATETLGRVSQPPVRWQEDVSTVSALFYLDHLIVICAQLTLCVGLREMTGVPNHQALQYLTWADRSSRSECPRKMHHVRKDRASTLMSTSASTLDSNSIDYAINGVDHYTYTYGYWFENPFDRF